MVTTQLFVKNLVTLPTGFGTHGSCLMRLHLPDRADGMPANYVRYGWTSISPQGPQTIRNLYPKIPRSQVVCLCKRGFAGVTVH